MVITIQVKGFVEVGISGVGKPASADNAPPQAMPPRPLSEFKTNVRYLSRVRLACRWISALLKWEEVGAVFATEACQGTATLSPADTAPPQT